MNEHDRLIDDDLAAWNEADPAARRELIARGAAAWRETGR
jgi:hypothetical protein